MCHFWKSIYSNNIESFPFLVLGNPNSKSIETSIQGWLRTSKALYDPWDFTLDLGFWRVIHLLKILSKSLFMCGKNKCFFKISNVLKSQNDPLDLPHETNKKFT